MVVTTVTNSEGTPEVVGVCSRHSRRASSSVLRNSIFSCSPGNPTVAQIPSKGTTTHPDPWNVAAWQRSSTNHPRTGPCFSGGSDHTIDEPVRLPSRSEAATVAGASVFRLASPVASPKNTEADRSSSGGVWSADFLRSGQRPRRHRQQQQYHHHPLRTRTGFVAGLWRSLFQQQLVLVLTLVLVFSGIESVVHCDEIVSNGGRGGDGGDGSDRVLLNRGNLLDGVVQMLTATTSKGNGHRASGSVPASTDQFTSNNNNNYNELDDGLDGGRHFTHHWAVHIPEGDQEQLADRVAAEHGFINRGKIFHEHYHFEHSRLHKRSLSPSKPHQQRLETDQRVRWARQQRAKSRQKRDYRPLTKLPYQLPFQLNDPKWPEMWYLNRGNGLDMNVIPAWKEGVTGKGVVVTILDDGLESDHPDLEHNYDPQASYDVNSSDNDPMPHYDLTDSNRHGTRCAGEVAATANNSKCAVGIAFGARVGGVRMLDGDVTDIVEARSLGYNSQHIDIYSASWGPDDDGKTVDGPGELATRAFIEGVRNGRGGKGSIFIWASGNGGREHDNCNCDGYTNSIWTLSISSASQEGLVPWFSEMCSSTLATTYSSGNTNEKQVITTDLHHTCTSSHTGTSASAPLAAGIAALVLEANRNLTWRDLQHIVVRTAKPGNLSDPNWSVNGVGRRVSHSFGYGLMDAAAMVRVARNWKTVPEQQVCEINARHLDKQIPPRTKVTLQLIVEHCMGVNYLEHVQAKITLTSQRRGDIQIFLTSPSGTRVTLLTPRSHDLSRSGFNQWPFMSVHTWGEAPHGTWQLEIHNEGRLLGYSVIRGWSLLLYGTSIPPDPNDPPNVPRIYSTPPPPLPPIFAQSGFNSYTVSGASKNYYSSSVGGTSVSSVPSSPSSSSSSSSVSSSGAKPNRKQQQQQLQYNQSGGSSSITVQYGMTPAYGSSNGGGSGSSNNSNRGKGKNNKNKPNKNSSKTTTTTLRPPPTGMDSSQQQQTTMNLYNYGAGSASYGTGGSGGSGRKNPSSKQKPPPPLQTINYGRGDQKYHAATSSMQDKQIAIKAPKQVKQNGFQSSSSKSSSSASSSSSTSSSASSGRKATSTTVSATAGDHSTAATAAGVGLTTLSSSDRQLTGTGVGSTSALAATTVTASPAFSDRYPAASSINARIPKVFQQYDKIQHFYPELQPYSSVRDEHLELPLAPLAPAGASNGGTGSNGFQQTLGNSKSPGVKASGGGGSSASPGVILPAAPASLGKPSRANTKIFFPDSDIIDAIPRKISSSLQPMPPSYVSSPYLSRTQSSFISSSSDQKHTKAQITQWDLIFYGTETPAQPNDPVRFGKPGFDSNFGGEMEHNALEFDSGVTSDQWRDMQQISEGHGEAQRTVSNDVTATSCASFGVASCIECQPSSRLYKGHCYLQCPPGTYASQNDTTVTSKPAAGSNRDGANDGDDDEKAITNGQTSLPPSSLRKRTISRQQVFDDEAASPGSSAGRPMMVASEASGGALPPNHHKPREDDCRLCHTTCLTCSGPAHTDCTKCQAAFRFETIVKPTAEGEQPGNAICVSINAKRPPSAESGGRLKALVRPEVTAPPSATTTTTTTTTISYLMALFFLSLVLLGAFGVIYVLWSRCFQGTPGGMLEELGGDGGPSGSSTMASIRYDRVQTNEMDVDSGASEDEDDEDDYEDNLFSISTEIIAPIER
ncbi:furin-like protease 1, isoforms 1/1-X/2 [Anopheles aquasalis]|uniref:furin-like protease 1, isoforms 1/1-X/2 n=1 Tax=Anopheles aquasalis TaxID=42839 RepID=UPI00215B5C97|nr:furin-like protease 1, isoforms 1/1-X/2 [Anopheles aquasalis]